MSSGTWTTTNGGAKVTVSASGVGALIAVGYALTHPHQVSEAASGAVTILAITFGSLIVLAATAVVLKLRRHSRTAEPAGSRQPASLLRQNPNAIPVREALAIAPPVQPIVNVNIDAGLLAGLMEAARQQQPVPVYVQSVQAEPQQEIR
jgi:hypothetical protein